MSLTTSCSQAKANISGSVTASSGNSNSGIATRVIMLHTSWNRSLRARL